MANVTPDCERCIWWGVRFGSDYCNAYEQQIFDPVYEAEDCPVFEAD